MPTTHANPRLARSYKAFIIAYLYQTLPKLVRTLVSLAAKKISPPDALAKVKKVLVNTTRTDRLPFLLARLIFTYYFTDSVLTRVTRTGRARQYVAPIAALAASYWAYSRYKRAVVKRGPPELARKRLLNISSELTATLTARSLDTLIRPLLSKATWIPSQLRGTGDVALFSASCFVIMFSWFYLPLRMQPRYRQWITDIAEMDSEFVDALRLIRDKELIYGETNPHETLLVPLCERYSMAPELGNTTSTYPMPCILVHAGVTHNCELHALWRFKRGFKSAFLIYLPLNLLLVLKRGDKVTLGALFKALKMAVRSSTFLASFIFLCWYSVCFVRSRVGPWLWPKASAQEIEDTWGPGLGSALCGLSKWFFFAY